MPDSGVPVAVAAAGPQQAGATAGLDLSRADGDSLTELAGRLRDAGVAVLRPGSALASVVAAVPDAWLASGVDGAARREAVRLVLAGERRLPLLAIVGYSQAIVAWESARTRDGGRLGTAEAAQVVIVCHIDEAPASPLDVPAAPGGPAGQSVVPDGPAPAIRLGLCASTGRAVRLLDCDMHRLSPGAASFGHALIAELGVRTAALPGAGRADVGRAAAGGEAVLGKVYAELGHRRRRLEISLAAATANPAFLSTPVVGLPGAAPDQWATAAQVQRCFTPTAQALTAGINALQRTAGRPAEAMIILAGPGAANPLAHDLLVRETARHTADGRAPTIAVAGQLAAAQGAALIAGGQVTADLALTADVRLPVHRRVGGRLRSETIPISTAVHGGAGPAGRDGTPITVQVPGAEQPDVRLEIVPAHGAAVSAIISLPAPVPEGTYQVGLWPDLAAGAVLALRPADGTSAVLFPLPPDARHALAQGPLTAED